MGFEFWRKQLFGGRHDCVLLPLDLCFRIYLKYALKWLINDVSRHFDLPLVKTTVA